MIKVIISLISIGLLILDNSLLPLFQIKGIYPSLLFTFAVTYSFMKKKDYAVFIGVLSGFLQDIYFSNSFGINCLTNMLLCLIASAIGDTIVKNKKTIPVIGMFFITLTKFAVISIILYFIKMKISLSIIQMVIISLENAVITFIIYGYIARKIDKNNAGNQWRFR